jgi:hypothetical protein
MMRFIVTLLNVETSPLRLKQSSCRNLHAALCESQCHDNLRSQDIDAVAATTWLHDSARVQLRRPSAGSGQSSLPERLMCGAIASVQS